MSSIERVRQWIAEGRLISPRADQPNLVDLVAALGRCIGAQADETPASAALAAEIAPGEHLVFVLVDGMGTELLERLPESAFLRRHHKKTLETVFLSTTGCALTTLATGAWPSEHGIPGWWTYLPDRDKSIVSLPFVERHGREPLLDQGLRIEDVYPLPALWASVQRKMSVILPADLVGTPYSVYIGGGQPQEGYAGMLDAFDRAEGVLGKAGVPSFTYVYLPQVDTETHMHGPDSEEVLAILKALDERVERFAVAVGPKTRVVVGADHGFVGVPDEACCVLDEMDPLMGMLRCWPSAEPAVPVFHVKEGKEAAFLSGFNERYGERFSLLTTAEAESLRLFGPEPLSKVMRERLGTFIGIAPDPTLFAIRRRDGRCHLMKGVHGGLRPAEMHIPLIVV